MYKTSILPEKLQSFDYYKNKLPLFLQNSNGFLEHYRIFYDFLVGNQTNNGVVGTSDKILNLMNIFDEDILEIIRDLPDSGSTGLTDYGTKCDILDKLGSIFGVKRNVQCTLFDSGTVELPSDWPKKMNINLNNEDFLFYIKFMLIAKNIDGSYKSIQEAFDAAKIRVIVRTASDKKYNLQLVDFTGSINKSYSQELKYFWASVLCSNYEVGNLSNPFTLFLTDIENVTINKNWITINVTVPLKWDSKELFWDYGVWSA